MTDDHTHRGDDVHPVDAAMMEDGPYNAGKSVTVKQVVPMPVVDADFGEVTITENWGRLFIKWRDQQIVIERSAYKNIVAAISEFIGPAAPTEGE
jgi:hypothetical protein